MTTELVVLPRFIALHRLERYLRFMVEDGERHGHFQMNEANLVTPYTKFEVQRSERGGNLLNIRSCYNNKYLVRKSRTEPWVVGEADVPEEDTNKWNCTLFEVSIVVDRNPNLPTSYRFMHVPTGSYLGTIHPVAAWRDVLHLKAVIDGGFYESYRITNMDSLVVLPRYVTFKGHNGLYLSTRVPMFRIQVQFASNDKFDSTIRYEIFIQSDGTFCIRSLHNNMFLRRDENYHNWLVAEAASMNDPDTRFTAVQVTRNQIAIKLVRNNRFCTAVQGVPLANCLTANREEVDRFCLMEVEEVVSSRRIYDVVFRTEDARIYNQTDGISLVKTVYNPTLSQQDGTVRFVYTKSTRSTWNVSHGWSVSVSTTISTGIPILLEGNISIGSQYSGQYSWGETISETIQDVSNTNTTTPPMTKSVVTALLTRGAIDVPFSYTQHDTLYSGQPPVITRFHDGIFTGENTNVTSDGDEYILPSTTELTEDDDQNLSSTIAVTKDDDGQYLSSTTTVTKGDDDGQNLSSATAVTKDDDDQSLSSATAGTKDDDDQNLSSATTVTIDDDDGQNLSSATAVTIDDDDQNLSSATTVTKDDDDGQNLSSTTPLTRDDDNDDHQTLSSATPVITATTVTKHDDDEQNISSTTTE